MRINWKLRLQNKVTLMAIIVQVLAIIYMGLDMFGIVPKIEQEVLKAFLYGIVELFVLLGVVVDPTTQGVNDSNRAMNYAEPKESDYNG